MADKVKSRRKWLIAGGVVAGLMLLSAVVLLLSLPALMKWIVVRAAHERGVDLVVQSVDPGWGWVRIRGADVTLRGVDGLHAKLERATVELQGFSPSRVEVRGLNIDVRGSAADVALDVTTFAKAYGDALRFPVVADGVSVDWREREGDRPWLALGGAMLTPVADGVKVRAESASVLDVNVGPVGASWSSDRVSASLGFGQADLDRALVTVEVPHGLTGGNATVTLRPIRLTDLQKPLGIAIPLRGEVTVSGHAELALRPDKAGHVEGRLHLALKGWVPPHPRELDGIVFGEETTFDTKLKLDPLRKHVDLTESTVAAGAFVLKGSGAIDRRGDHAAVSMDMSGAIPCQALAKSAVGAHLPGPIGTLIGDVVKGALKGSVRVGVTVKGDTKNLAAAEVKHTVSVGCGLRL